MINILKLNKYKRSDVAVFLGSGRSINRISTPEWNAIKKCDVWTVNNWVYHPFIVPNFYHIETKHYGYDILQRRLHEKKKMYGKTKFIFPTGKTIKMKDGSRRVLKNVVAPEHSVFEYSMIGRDVKRTHPIFTADYVMDEFTLTKSYDMSITCIFELLYKMGYKKIITFGIDLMDSYYFWTGGDPIYGKVHHQTNKAHENKDPKEAHNTHKIKDFIFDFNDRWMKPLGKEIVVGHKDSLLCSGLRKTSIRKLIEC